MNTQIAKLDSAVVEGLVRLGADRDTHIVGLTDLVRALDAEPRAISRTLNRLLVRGTVNKVLRGRRSGYFLATNLS